MKKCKIYTVPGSSHTGFFWLQTIKVYICVMKYSGFNFIVNIQVFASKCLLYFKKGNIKRIAGIMFLQQIYVMCPSLLLLLPLVQHSAAARLKGLISKEMFLKPPLQQHSRVPIGGGSFFLLQPILNLSRFHHFHSDLKNFMDGLPEAMKIIVNKPFSLKAFLSDKANKSQELCHLF